MSLMADIFPERVSKLLLNSPLGTITWSEESDPYTDRIVDTADEVPPREYTKKEIYAMENNQHPLEYLTKIP